MQSTIEQTDVSEPRSPDTPATLTDERGDASTTTITGLQSHPGRRRRRVVLRAVAAAATLAAAAAAIAIAVVDRSDREPGTHSIPGLIEAPPLAEPWVTAGPPERCRCSWRRRRWPSLGSLGSTAAVPVFVEGPPLAEPEASR